MKFNYRRIGDFIERVNTRNKEGLYSELLGININKYFMPSVANVVGTDLTKYKVVQHQMFACNRMHVGRDMRLPIAVSKSTYPFLVSPAYDVFEITKPDQLLHDYLMMWFTRAEFDRNTWFFTDTDVRGKLGWDSFCDMTFPVPSLEKQQEIVDDYNTVQERIRINEELNTALEETAQTLYKHWFVDFEFPDSNGNPYKSSGGAMEYNEELDMEIPVGWVAFKLEELIDYNKGKAFQSVDYRLAGVPIVRVSDLTFNSINFSSCHFFDTKQASLLEFDQYLLDVDDIIITSVGSWATNPNSVVGKVVKVPENGQGSLLNQNMVKLKAVDKEIQLLLYTILKSSNFSDYVISGAQGSANQASVTLKHLFDFNICLPKDGCNNLGDIFNNLFDSLRNNESENQILKEIENIQLATIATLVNETEVINY